MEILEAFSFLLNDIVDMLSIFRHKSLLIGIQDKDIAKLQRIQNSAARLVSLCKKYEHITPILKGLHWLPIKYRIVYKILLLTFKCLSGQSPQYL